MTAANWARLRRYIRHCILRPLVEFDLNNLRNDVASALYDDRVTHANILPCDLVLVVQCRVRHDDTADRHRLKFGNRC